MGKIDKYIDYENDDIDIEDFEKIPQHKKKFDDEGGKVKKINKSRRIPREDKE